MGTNPTVNLLKVDTSAKAMPWPNLPSPELPKITLNNQIIRPDTPPDSPVGYQAVILENQTVKVLLNKYYTLPKSEWSWMNSSYVAMYGNMKQDLLNSGALKKDNLLVLASFGLGNNLPPTANFTAFLKENGAGSRLDHWLAHCDPGSQMDNKGWWMVIPCVYILAGKAGSKTGTEGYQTGEWNGQTKYSLIYTIR